MLRPEHSLRTPPAIAPAAVTSLPALSCLRPRAVRLPREAPLPRGKTSSAVRASALPMREAAAARMPSPPHREVALALAEEVYARLGAQLLPSAVPADVAEFVNGAGTAVGTLDVRRGAPASSGGLARFEKPRFINPSSEKLCEIDFVLQSSLHCKVPNGAIDITSILIFLNASTDAPHFLMEFIQGSPASMVVILDLLPRKDLALHPEYIEKYYQNTQLDKQREKIEELPQTRPYRSTSLFVRSACSPTAVSVSIDCGQGGESILEEIVYGHLASVAKGVLQIWLDSCAGNTSEMTEVERDAMVKRDQIVRSKSIEVDLTANLPRMFGSDVSSRVIAEIRKAFGVQEA